jgi:hypothetical protein
MILAGGGLFLAVRAFQQPSPSSQTNATPAPRPETPVPTPSHAPSSPSAVQEGGVFGAMLNAIQGASPPGWQFALHSDRLDGDWRLDGTVDDGSGPGRLSVDLTMRPGMLVGHPCADPEFRQGGRCIERPLGDGALLVLRGVVRDNGGMKTIEAVLIHPDGSGGGAEAGNWTIEPLSTAGSISQSQLSAPTVTRAEPLYTVEELGRLLQAVDEAVSRLCRRVNCR